MSYCIYVEERPPYRGKIVTRPIPSKTAAVRLAHTEARFGRLRHCDYVAVMPHTSAQALVRSGRRAA